MPKPDPVHDEPTTPEMILGCCKGCMYMVGCLLQLVAFSILLAAACAALGII